MSPPRRRLVGGLDLGGTKIQAVVLDGRRTVIGEAKSATPTTDGAQAMAARSCGIAAIARAALRTAAGGGSAVREYHR